MYLDFFLFGFYLTYEYFSPQNVLRKNKKKPKVGRATVIPSEVSSNYFELISNMRCGPECRSGLYKLEEFREEDNVLIGEGPALNRPLSSLEKVHIISDYALSRKDIRHDQEKILNSPQPLAVCCSLHVFSSGAGMKFTAKSASSW